MEIPDNLLCVFSARVESGEDGAVIRIPDQELSVGEVESGQTYRFALIDPQGGSSEQRSNERSKARRKGPEPPVEEGEQIDVEIESIGDQGDGIARVDRGYVIIVPGTEVTDRVTVEITDVKQNMAFAEVIEHHHPMID